MVVQSVCWPWVCFGCLALECAASLASIFFSIFMDLDGLSLEGVALHLYRDLHYAAYTWFDKNM